MPVADTEDQQTQELPAGYSVKPLNPTPAPTGLPAGYSLKPVASAPAPVQTLPQGYTAKPIQQVAPAVAAAGAPVATQDSAFDKLKSAASGLAPGLFEPAPDQPRTITRGIAPVASPTIPLAPPAAPAPPATWAGQGDIRLEPPTVPGPAPMNLKPLLGGPAAVAGELPAGTPQGEAERRAYASPMTFEQQQEYAARNHQQPLREGLDQLAQTPLLPKLNELDEWATRKLGGGPALDHQKAVLALYDNNHPYQASVNEAIQDFIAGQTTPANLTLLATAPESKVMTAFFTAQAAKGTYDTAEEAYKAHLKGQNPAALKLATEAGLNGLMGLAGAAHLVGGLHVPGPEHLPAPVRESLDRWSGNIVKNGPNAPAAEPSTVEQPNVPRETTAPKPVLHGSDDVEELRQSAARQSGAIGDAAATATDGVPGAKVEAVRDSKDSDRIEDKAERQGVKPSQIADIAAAKIVVPDQAAADAVLQNLHEQMPVEKVEGSVTGEPGKNGVRQVQAIVNTGAEGEPIQRAEILIQTPEMARATGETHDDYRKAQELRQAGDEPGAKAIEERIQAEHEAADKTASERIADTEPKFKSGSTQHNIADDSDAGKALTAIREKIAPADLAGDGKDVDNHVTVRYGLKGELTPQIRSFLESQSPFDARLGAIDAFKPSEFSDGAAPLHAPIESPELTRLNKEIEKHGEFEASSFPDYKPHATVAYVKPDAAAKYVGDKTTEGKTFHVDSISVTDKNGNAVNVPLKGKANAEPERAPTSLFPTENEAPQQDEVKRVPVRDIALDPQRFQYKLDTDKTGVTNLLKGRKWNENLSGRINVWRDPADGKLYVVNGHHRFQLAKENGIPDVKVDYINAPSAATARGIGALQNIADGRGSAVDAARFFRDSGYTPEELDDLGISMGEATAANGVALARLDPSLFDQVVSGKLRQGRAIAIGKASADAADQEALLKLIQRSESKGRKVTDDVVDELARMVKGSSQHTETQHSLFGAQEMTRNLALEKADISTAIREKINTERRTFQGVADAGKAATLGKVEGQSIQAGKNAAIAEEAKQAQELYDRLSTRGGTIDDILNRSAKELAAGGNANGIKQRAYDDVRKALREALPGGEGVNDKRVQEAPQTQPARAAGSAPIPPERRGSVEPKPDAGSGVRSSGTTGPTELKAPIPREERPAKFEYGTQSTPVEVKGADGKWKPATLDYFNSGKLPQEPRHGRVTFPDGTKLHAVPENSIRPAQKDAIEIKDKTVKPLTRAPGEAAIIKRTEANAEQLTKSYLEKNTVDGVPTIATDAAKELYPEFQKDPANNDREVAAGAKAVRNWALDHALSKPVDPEKPGVLITTASPGSGKTTGQALGGNRVGIGMKIEAISDDVSSFQKIMQKVIDSGRRPVVEWVYVDDPGKTVDRMFKRAVGHDQKPGIGRTVQLSYMNEAYYQVPRVIEKMMEKFGDQAQFHVIDNSGAPGEATAHADVAPFIEKVKEMGYNQIKGRIDESTEALKQQGLFKSQRGQDVFRAAQIREEVAGSGGSGQGSVGSGRQGSEGQPQASGSVLANDNATGVLRSRAEEAGKAASTERSDTLGILSGDDRLESDRRSDEQRAASRKAKLADTAKRTLPENAASHKSEVAEVAGRKALVLDPDGEAVWHRLFRKAKDVDGQNPLGAGQSWRGVVLDKAQVNTAIAYLKAGAEDLNVSGLPSGGAAEGYERLVKLLKDARNEQGGATILRGDYRADTAREEATHQWQREHELDKSDAMVEVASRPEFGDAVNQLKKMGYENIKPRALAAEAMAKAMAGDPEFKLTDEQRESLVRSFLTEAAEDKGAQIFRNLPEMDPRLKTVADEVKRGYDDGEQYDQRDQGSRGQASRSGDGQGRSGTGKETGAREGDRGGQRTNERSQSAVPEERQEETQLAFQRGRAPKPPPSMALPGFERDIEANKESAAEEQGRQLTDKLLEPGKNIDKATGEMERNSPLFRDSEASGQGSLFQRAQDDKEDVIAKPAFKKWFGDSKVTSGKDSPQIVYHGTDANFDVFDKDKLGGATNHPSAGLGFFFTEEPSVAALFNGGVDASNFPIRWRNKTGAQTLPVYLKIDKPFELSADKWRDIVSRGGADGEPQFQVNSRKYIADQRALLEKQGFDGVHIKGDPKYQDSMREEYGWDQWVAFKPEQIKSAIGNSGDFDALNPSMLFQKSVNDHSPLLPYEDRGAKAERDLDERIAGAPRTSDIPPDEKLPFVERQQSAANSAKADREMDERFGKAPKPEGRKPAVSGEASNPVARSVSDLVDELKNAPKADKGTALDRVSSWTTDSIDQSLGRSKAAFERIPNKFEKAFAWAKATTAALVHDYLHPLEQTDWKTQVGQMDLAKAETSFKLHDLAKALKEAAPKELDRIAMAHWMEAAGDEQKLKEWRAGSKARAMQAMNDPLMTSDRKRYLRDAQAHYEKALDLTPDQKALASRLRQHFDDMLQIAKDNGLIDYGYRNYVMHLYEKADAANLLHLVDTNEINPNPAFIKKRFYDTFYNAEGGGLTPKSKDIGFLLTAYDKSMNDAIASRTFMRSLLDAKSPDGRPIAAIKMRGGWLIAKAGQEPQIMKQRARPTSLEGYRDFDRPQLRNFLFKPTTEDLAGFDPKLFEEDPEKLAFRGDLIIHPKYAAQVEDMLTPSWFERGEGRGQKLGNTIVKTSALAKELMTAIAPFHMVQEGVHGMEHKVNPFNLPKVDLTKEDQRMLASHGLSLVNYDAEGLFGTKALRGLTEYVPGVNRAMDAMNSFSRWQFEDYIPRLKMRMATEAYERNIKRYPQLSKEQVAELTAKQSNAAFGNLNTAFDAVPRTKTFKTLLRLATFAPDFLESRIRFVGQSFGRYGGEQRAALIRGALVMYGAARVTNALLNDGDAKWDAQHAFSIVHNGKAYSLRTVQGDILHAVTDPRGFIYNRLNPLTTRPIVEFLSGRDQMGRPKSALSEVQDLGKSVLPFGIQKVIQTPDEDWLNSILTSTGLESKNDRTPTEMEVHKLYVAHIPDSNDDEEKQAEARKLRTIEDSVRAGKTAPADVWRMVDDGKLTPKEAGRTVSRGQESRLAIEFKSLGLKDAMKVYGELQAESKHPKMYPHVALDLAELKPEMEKKRALVQTLAEADRGPAADRLSAMLDEDEEEPK